MQTQPEISGYTYQGFVGYDHAMDSEAIAKGQFHITGFNVCMQAKGSEVGALIAAQACDESNALQNFNLREDMTIRLASQEELCLTIGDEVSYGRNGPGGHEIRQISMQACSEDKATHQQWVLRDSVE